MNTAGVSAVIVTRGDVDLTEILDSLPHAWERVVWDNSVRDDRRVYGRYAAIGDCEHDLVYVQDDDCLVDAERVAAAYEPGRLVANMPAGRWPDYPDSTLVGWGAIFDRKLPVKAFEAFLRSQAAVDADLWDDFIPDEQELEKRLQWWMQVTPWLARTCDVVFSALTPRTVIDVGFQHLPWAEDPARAMFLQPCHKTERDRMLDICRRVRTWDDDDRRIP